MATTKKAPKTTSVQKVTAKVGTQAQRDAINKGIDKLNKTLAGGISGVKDSKSGKTVKEDVYFTKGGAVTSSGKKLTEPSPVITPESLQKTTVPDLTQMKVTDPGNIAGAGNAGIASMLSSFGVSQDANGQLVTAPAGSAESAAQDSIKQQASLLSQAIGLKQAPESSVDIYNAMEEKKKMERAQKEVNRYTGQLNSITANSQAEQLKLEQQGRGQTTGFIGGEQARINREAAIAALPVQAQLSAAQGNLDFAQKQLDTMFQLKLQDSINKTNFWNSTVDSVLNFANDSQKTILNAKLADINTKSAKEQANLTYLRQLSAEARDNGNANAISALSKIDTASPTFEQDVASAARMIVKPVAGGGVSAPTIKTINGVDYQWNANTGQWENPSGVSDIPDDGTQTQINETLSLARELLSSETAGKSGAVGFGFQKFVPFGLSLGLQGDRAAFENKVNTLKANLTLPNLSLLKGPMSDKDIAFLQAIGSSITTNMSEDEFDTQMKKVIQKFENKQAVQTPYGSNIITAPDGMQIEIIN